MSNPKLPKFEAPDGSWSVYKRVVSPSAAQEAGQSALWLMRNRGSLLCIEQDDSLEHGFFVNVGGLSHEVDPLSLHATPRIAAQVAPLLEVVDKLRAIIPSTQRATRLRLVSVMPLSFDPARTVILEDQRTVIGLQGSASIIVRNPSSAQDVRLDNGAGDVYTLANVPATGESPQHEVWNGKEARVFAQFS
jgi:hypothetical protein